MRSRNAEYQKKWYKDNKLTQQKRTQEVSARIRLRNQNWLNQYLCSSSCIKCEATDRLALFCPLRNRIPGVPGIRRCWSLERLIEDVQQYEIRCKTCRGKQYDKQLGMSTGTATGRLRKIILFNLVQQLNFDTCYRCNNKIEMLEEFSIDHKKPWRDVSTELFWDIDNIAFSHNLCNTNARRK